MKFYVNMRNSTFKTWMMGAAVVCLGLVGCKKEETEPSPGNVVDEQFQPKNNTFMFRGSMTGSAPWGAFSYHRWNIQSNCSETGSIPFVAAPAVALDANILPGTPSFVRISQTGQTGFKTMQRGDQFGSLDSWGPWYLLTPEFGPPLSVRKRLLMRLKMVPLSGGGTYNGGITYNGTTNTWNYASAAATGRFQFQEVTQQFLSLCDSRN